MVMDYLIWQTHGADVLVEVQQIKSTPSLGWLALQVRAELGVPLLAF